MRRGKIVRDGQMKERLASVHSRDRHVVGRHRRAVKRIEQQIYALGSCFAAQSLKNIIENIVSYVQGHRRRAAHREDVREPAGSSGMSLREVTMLQLVQDIIARRVYIYMCVYV